MGEIQSVSRAERRRLLPGQHVGWLVQFGTDDLAFIRSEEGLTVATMRAASLHGILVPLVVDMIVRGKECRYAGEHPA